MTAYLEGRRIVDATESVLVQVSCRDAAGGVAREPLACAVARACQRSSLSDSRVDVADARIHLTRAYLLVGDEWVRYLVTEKLREEIVKFDRGGEFRPGVYRLKVVPGSKPSKKTMMTKPPGRKEKHGRVTRQYHLVRGVRPRSPV